MAIWEVMNSGGWMMWVILIVSVIATAITLERAVALYLGCRLDTRRFLGRIIKLVEERDYAGAIEACNLRTRHPLPAVLLAGLSKANRRDKEIEKAMEAEMLGHLPRVRRGLGFLGLLGNVATLLGLLGTIFGLIRAFSGVSAASAAARQQVLAEGISIAMYTTAFGILVAVPILFAHNLLSGRMENILIRVEEGAVGLVAALGARMQRDAPQQPMDRHVA
ncbi:MAG: MotA/TolQ/ExbB proton channel family protein [Deltaproteobacteria bacterium]|nr:MotA/TolQ/ExbB proton channel family protein [Deltaproteobacteria bacterium]